MFDSIRETIDYAVENKMSFADIMIQEEMELSGKTRDEVRETMKQNLDVMRDAVIKGSTGEGVKSVTGYTGKMPLNLLNITRIIMPYQVMKWLKQLKVRLLLMK